MASPGFAYDCFGVVDEGTHELKVYATSGSYVGVARTLAPDVVGYAVGTNVKTFIYLGTSAGVISRYSLTWTFINSFATNTPLGDLAAGRGYNGMWGDWVYLGPSQPPPYIKVYLATGSLYGSFALPGISSCGAMYKGRDRTYMWCLRDNGSERWAYQIDTGPLMALEPESLGRVKAMFK